MVKKTIHKPHHTQHETKQKKFLHDVEFNLHMIIFLMGVLVIILSGIIFYMGNLTVAIADREDILPYDDFTYYSYNLVEFSRLAKMEVVEMEDVIKYLEENDFEVTIDQGEVLGQRQTSCNFNVIRKEEICTKLELRYSIATPNKVELFIIRD